jgi:hypothetical protein
MHLDFKALAAALSFCIQIAAGAAPVKWPQYAWLADLIFWGACVAGVGFILWWLLSSYRVRWPFVPRKSRVAADDDVRQEYFKEIVWLPSLVQRGSPIISDVRFEKCMLRGPASLYSGYGNVFEFNNAQQPTNLFVEVPMGTHLQGTIRLTRTFFRDCYFDGDISFIGASESLDTFRRGIDPLSVQDWRNRHDVKS